ncbi:hypothetical protein AB6T38_02900 [Aliiglaciecola sp. SL4]|uniref:hypothetical protein n=1 Tax=Aliiglaciecola sp. SL4 TaxID=3239806 RepID=UPI00355C8EFF
MKILTALILICSFSAQASIIGTEVVCGIEPSIIWDCDNKMSIAKENESEFNLLLVGNPHLSVDFEDNSLMISNLHGNLGLGANELLTLSILPNLFNPADFDLLTNVVGFDASDINFNGELMALNLHNTRWSSDDYILLSFMNSANAISNAPTLLLFLIGIVALRRRLIKNNRNFQLEK